MSDLRFPEMTDEVRNWDVYKRRYEHFYPIPSGVIFTRTVKKTEECGFAKTGIYFRTDGLIVNYNINITDEERKEFEDRVAEIAKDYIGVQQIAKRIHLPIVVPEHIREEKILTALNYMYSPKIKKALIADSRRRKKAIKIEKEKYTKYRFKTNNCSPSVAVMFSKLHQGIYGEYRKNVEGDVIINFVDITLKYVGKQYRIAPVSLFDFLMKYELITLVEDRDSYKKFYFSEKIFDAEVMKRHFQIRGSSKKTNIEK